MCPHMLPDHVDDNKKTYKISDVNFIGELIGELTHAALNDVGGSKDCSREFPDISNLYGVSIQGDKMVVCGIGGVALFRLSLSM